MRHTLTPDISTITTPAEIPGRPSPFVKTMMIVGPVTLTTAAAAAARVWHLQGAAHSIGDALLCGGTAVAFTGLAGLFARGRHGSRAAAGIFGSLAGSIGGTGVIAYTTAPALALIGWLAGTVVAYALTWAGWRARHGRREDQAHEVTLAAMQQHHEQELARIYWRGATDLARINADRDVEVARELGAAARDAAALEARHPAPAIAPYHVPAAQLPAPIDWDRGLAQLVDGPIHEPGLNAEIHTPQN